MPRIRTIKPEAPQHRKVGPLSDRAFRVWLVLLTQADDEGRMVADASQVRLWAFGYHPDVTLRDVEDAIQEVAKPGLIRLYSAGDTRYAFFPSWKDHQCINRPTLSKLPEPPRLSDASMSAHGTLTEDSLRTHAGSRIKDQGSEGIKEQEQGRERKGVQRETIGEPPAGLRSASPLEAASLRPADSHGDSTGELKDAAKKQNGPELSDKRIEALMRFLGAVPGVSLPQRSGYSPEEIQEAQRRLKGGSNGKHADTSASLIRCHGVTRNNLECRAWALPASEFCRLHQRQAP